MPDSFLTVAEVAELLKLNPQTVRNWIDRGERPAVRLGQRRLRIRRSDLDRLIDSGSAEGLSDRHARSAGPEGALEVGEEELRDRFAAFLAESIRVVGRGSRQELLTGLEQLVKNASALVNSVGGS
jgi:excisionase family DNA binding protein